MVWGFLSASPSADTPLLSSLYFLSSVFFFSSSCSSFDLILLPTIDPRVFLLPLPVLYKITLVTTVSARQGGLIRPLGVLTSLGRTNRFNSLPSRYTPLELPVLQTIPFRRNDSAAAESLFLSSSCPPSSFLSLVLLFSPLFLYIYVHKKGKKIVYICIYITLPRFLCFFSHTFSNCGYAIQCCSACELRICKILHLRKIKYHLESFQVF